MKHHRRQQIIRWLEEGAYFSSWLFFKFLKSISAYFDDTGSRRGYNLENSQEYDMVFHEKMRIVHESEKKAREEREKETILEVLDMMKINS